VESDPKRKSEAITTDITDAMSKEKKQRLEEETRTLIKYSNGDTLGIGGGCVQ